MPRLDSSRRLLASIVCVLALNLATMIACQRSAVAWWSGGHKACTAAAVKMLPEDVPEFFRSATEELAEMSTEPDEWKSQMAPRLRASEQPEHFIDLEHFDGKPIPRHRFEALTHYMTKHIDIGKGGTLPYAIEEGFERLQLAFRQVRIYPESVGAKHRAIVYAGWLAHYCGDLAMPLHTTVNYDGKPGENGQTIQKGIHARLDAFPEKNGFTAEMLADKQTAERHKSVWELIERTINESHTHIDECYELDAAGGFDKEPEKAKAFVRERTRVAAKLTADLWYTAWVKSDPGNATIK